MPNSIEQLGQYDDLPKDDGLSKEKEKSVEKEKKPFYFIYRNNDLFEKYIPLISDLLQEQGYEVIIQSFPAETPEKKIKEWCPKNKEQIASTNVISDYTVEKSSDYQINPKINLDDLMDKATELSIMGFNMTEKEIQSYKNTPEDNLELEKEIAMIIIGRIQEATNGNIKKLYLIQPCLADHSMSEMGRQNSPKDQKCAKNIKDWILNNKNLNIEDVKIISSPENIPKGVEAGDYFMYDRHFKSYVKNSSDYLEKWIPQKKIINDFLDKQGLKLPWSNLYYQVIKEFKQIEPKITMDAAIKKILQEEIEKIEKKNNKKIKSVI